MTERIAIVGVGLIGGSLGLALRAAGWSGERIGVGRQPEQLAEAVRVGAIDRGETDAAAGVAAADMVVLAVPMGAMHAALTAVQPHLDPHAVVTDVGSVKGSVVQDAEAVLGGSAQFVPGHPIAGTERSGVNAAFPELFQGRRVILTPTAQTRDEAVQAVTQIWQLAGADVECLDVADHDRLLASTSHLPHMLAFGLVDALARGGDAERVFRYAAGGFRDFTRIASSDPVMWRDICIANRAALLDALAAYQDDLDALTSEVRAGDGDALLARFERAKSARDTFCE